MVEFNLKERFDKIDKELKLIQTHNRETMERLEICREKLIDTDCICNLKQDEVKELSSGCFTSLNIYMEDEIYTLVAIGEGEASIHIKFCPICGRSLKEVIE